MLRPFTQVDVFTTTPYAGNPVAVVLDGAGLTTDEMQRFANWTNLSETTFVLPPADPAADYLVRIFTPTLELPFAGHPTLGTCHAWLEAEKTPKRDDVIVQECGAGPGAAAAVERRPRVPGAAAGPIRAVDEALVGEICAAMGIERAAVVDAAWADNGPGWIALLLRSAEEVLAVRPTFIDQDVGLVGPHPAGSAEAWELRAFFPKDGVSVEDPVTGSLNASVAMWLLGTGRATAPYVARQGTALGRAGRIHVSRDADGGIWIGGGTVTCIEGQVEL